MDQFCPHWAIPLNNVQEIAQTALYFRRSSIALLHGKVVHSHVPWVEMPAPGSVVVAFARADAKATVRDERGARATMDSENNLYAVGVCYPHVELLFTHLERREQATFQFVR